ncbi:histone RNA hairpin-binding protein [Wyeomyia smithii]|uniref:histone RNA hairpin-binding protein n=1 Tax=Wyeomyia smithii TaxID=174621 RepID=UPI002467BA98|nr:histone RNA hairpin-binding protein [Wyeomyia smithii]
MIVDYDEDSLSDGELSDLSPCKAESKTTISDSLLPLSASVFSIRQKTKELCANEAKEKHSQPQEKTYIQWNDIVEEEKRELLTSKSEDSIKNSMSSMDLAVTDSKMSIEDSCSNSSSSRSGRQIEIDILDSANVEKYEKLIRTDKIKSPFKRRLSGGEEDDDDDGHVKFSEENVNCDDASSKNQHKKTKKHEEDHGRERFRKDSSSSGDGSSSSQSSRKPVEYEKDMAILVRRQKQIDYGKNTLGYENYMKQVPREQRTKDHPKTPPKHLKYSRRAWDGLIKVWRKKLHCFDPNAMPEADN